MRYCYFVQQKQWVTSGSTNTNLECDRYDSDALHFGFWDEKGLVAYLRALPYMASIGFMLDHEFAALLSQEEHRSLAREDALELSRLTLRSDITLRGESDQPHPIEHLLKALYKEAKIGGYHHFHVVMEPKWLPALNRRFGLPFRNLGKPYTFPDGTRTVAATALLAELEQGMKHRSAAKYQWYQQP